MKKPIISIVIAFILGIFGNEYLQLNILWLFIPFTFIIIKKYDNKKYLFLILFFLLGFLLATVKNNNYEKINLGIQRIKVIVYSQKQEEYGQSLVVKSLDDSNLYYQMRIFGKGNYVPGDILKVRADISLPEDNTNPGLFNYKQYLKSKDIFGLIECKTHNVEKIGETQNKLLSIKFAFNEKIINLFDSNFSESSSKLLKTLFLGENYLDKNENDNYRSLGISHLLAISGFHISLMYAILSLVIRKIRIPQNLQLISILAIFWSYGYLISFPPSVIRAIFSITMILISSKYLIPWDRKNILFLSLLVNLLINPFRIYSIGLQFSYLATFGIIEIIPKINLDKKGYFLKIAYFSFIIYMFLLPLQIFYFQEIHLSALIGNIFLAPVFSIIIVLGLLFILLSFIPILASGIVIILEIFVHLFNLLITGGMVFSSNLTTFPIDVFGIVFIYLLFYLIYKYKKMIFLYKRYLAFSLLIIFSIEIYTTYYLNPVSIMIIEIGQGDSFLVKNKQYNFLIDTGGSIWENDRSGEYKLVPLLKKEGVHRLDGVFITHFDEDHSGNLAYLAHNINIKTIFGRPGGKQILIDKYKLDLPYIELTNQELVLDNFSIQSFYTEQFIDENNNSLVLKLKTKKNSVLFTGDIEKEAEIKYLDYDIQSDVLKIGHHGSKTSTSELFLDKVNPNVAILSLSKKNNFGFPHEEVMERLKEKNISIYRTDEDGAIKIIFSNLGMQVNPHLPKKINSNYLVSSIYWIILFYILILYERRMKNELS